MFQQRRAYWRNLDNAAKMFSAASSPKDTRVFRFYCVLKEKIDGSILKMALDQTIQKYPVFLSVMRKGLFWHYLEKSDLRPVVREEYKEPCSHLYIRDKKELLFEVTYYKNRINFEVFHALTDGTGATEFLRELVKNYLYLTDDYRPIVQIIDNVERNHKLGLLFEFRRRMVLAVTTIQMSVARERKRIMLIRFAGRVRNMKNFRLARRLPQ